MSSLRRNILLMVVMVAAVVVAVAITPTHYLAEQDKPVNLETMISKQFGDWTVDESIVPLLVSPDAKKALDKIYTQVLARTYINSAGYRVMLSIPYGADQSDSLSVHDPEGCYPSQGFQIMSKNRDTLHTPFGDIPVLRMEASNDTRHEPVTYWFTVGSHAVNNDWDKKMAKLHYALKGEIPDGILFRVSSIDTDTAHAYRMQDLFVDELVNSLPQASRSRIAGLM